MGLCVQHLLWAWPNVTSRSVCVAFGGDYFPVPFWSALISLSVGGEAASGFPPHSTNVSKQNTMSPNCES